jgi:hypothetical protein
MITERVNAMQEMMIFQLTDGSTVITEVDSNRYWNFPCIIHEFPTENGVKTMLRPLMIYSDETEMCPAQVCYCYRPGTRIVTQYKDYVTAIKAKKSGLVLPGGLV